MSENQDRDRLDEELPRESSEQNAENGENTPGNHAQSTDDTDDTDDSETAAVEVSTRYHWTYADQQAYDQTCAAAKEREKRSEKESAWVYVLVIVAVFAISFCILAVSLSAGKTIHTGNGVPQNDAVSRADMQPIENAKRSTVVVEIVSETKSGTGTGIILNTNGYIATNHHVIDGATAIRVSFLDGTQASAQLIGSSEIDDLAVIRVDSSEVAAQLYPATFVESTEDNYVGQTVYAIGTPGGAEFAFTTTRGIISYVNREVRQYNDDGTMAKKLRTIQTDAKVNPGNSGGPLVDTDGNVVGIVSMKLSGGYEGIGFAIPSDGALEILNAIIRDGNADSVNSSLSFRRPLLGIVGVHVEANHTYVLDTSVGRIVDCDGSTVENVRNQIVQSGGTPGATVKANVSGIYVTAISDGLGAVGKIEVGDIILSVDGISATSMNVLSSALNDHYVGDVVTVQVDRNGKTLPVKIELMAQK